MKLQSMVDMVLLCWEVFEHLEHFSFQTPSLATLSLLPTSLLPSSLPLSHPPGLRKALNADAIDYAEHRIRGGSGARDSLTATSSREPRDPDVGRRSRDELSGASRIGIPNEPRATKSSSVRPWMVE
ncbi:hypothetical protein AOLI_G00118390 [Acnodon oligacanthus]